MSYARHTVKSLGALGAWYVGCGLLGFTVALVGILIAQFFTSARLADADEYARRAIALALVGVPLLVALLVVGWKSRIVFAVDSLRALQLERASRWKTVSLPRGALLGIQVEVLARQLTQAIGNTSKALGFQFDNRPAQEAIRRAMEEAVDGALEKAMSTDRLKKRPHTAESMQDKGREHQTRG